jgi:hypothetical protein
LLKPRAPFPPSDLDAVAACLEFKGKPRSLEDMHEAIARGVLERHK